MQKMIVGTLVVLYLVAGEFGMCYKPLPDFRNVMLPALGLEDRAGSQ